MRLDRVKLYCLLSQSLKGMLSRTQEKRLYKKKSFVKMLAFGEKICLFLNKVKESLVKEKKPSKAI